MGYHTRDRLREALPRRALGTCVWCMLPSHFHQQTQKLELTSLILHLPPVHLPHFKDLTRYH